jgi:hypothetical protein
MPEELFRFMAERPIQRIRNQTPLGITPPTKTTERALYLKLAEARATGDRKAVLKVGNAFTSSKEWVSDLANLPFPLATLDAAIFSIQPSATAATVKDVVTEVTGASPESTAKRPEFEETLLRLYDSFLAVCCSPGMAGGVAARLVRGIRICNLVERLASNDPALLRPLGVKRALTMPILLPKSLFPLPQSPSTQAKPLLADAEMKQLDLELAQRVGELQDMQGAVSELCANYRLDAMQRVGGDWTGPKKLYKPATPSKPTRTLAPVEPAAPTHQEVSAAEGRHPGTLSVQALSRLSAATRRVLSKLAIAPESSEVAKMVTFIEREVTERARLLFNANRHRLDVVLGRLFVPADTFSGADVVAAQRPAVELWPTATVLAPPSSAPPGPLETRPTVPEGAGVIRPVGVADLMLVREKFKSYVLGELAYVENVLKGKKYTRTYRRSDTTEQIIVEEAEQTVGVEQDLQSTERFELKTEASETVKSNAKVQADASITASYGPYVQVSANAGYAADRAREEASKSAMSFAREVISQAVSRVQERKLTRTTARALQEVEEKTEHILDNVQGADHVVGAYVWVDKIIEAQVVNYGRRTLLEFSVPEPAAFYRYARARRPSEGVTAEAPQPPGFYTGNRFTPLAPSDVTPELYQYWVGKYGVENAEPPPPCYSVIGTSLEKAYSAKETALDPYTKTASDLKAPEGYRASAATVTFTGTYHAHTNVEVLVGDQIVKGSGKQVFLAGEDAGVPLAMLVTETDALVANVEVQCMRSDETLAKWQLKTYTAIILAYQKLKQRYDEQVANARQGVAITGKNPSQNAEIIQTELKKIAIALLTAQRFELFDAVEAGAIPYGYPEVNSVEAEAEGSYIRFFEDGLEWAHMSYLFYPYFWGRKGQWCEVAQLEDADTVFARFLRAGAARVQVPVRPGFEEAMLFFLESGGKIWMGEDPPHVHDEDYVSMVQEVREQTGEDFVRGPGTVRASQGSRTLDGDGTDFGDDDVDREIRLEGEIYRILSVLSSVQVELSEEYRGPDHGPFIYSVGVKLVGEPWEVRVPTSFVLLQDRDAVLPKR